MRLLVTLSDANAAATHARILDLPGVVGVSRTTDDPDVQTAARMLVCILDGGREPDCTMASMALVALGFDLEGIEAVRRSLPAPR
jgi:hypothetical protein